VSEPEGPRPAWGAPPPAPPAAQPPPPAPTPPPPASTPSWERVTSAARRTIDLKLVIAVLIGLVSVTGATLAWRSSIASEKATDKDRQTLAEVVVLEQSRADIEVIVEDARTRFADHAIAVVNARLIEEQAQRAADAGDGDRAAELAAEAVELRTLARRVLQGGQGPFLLSDYVTEGEGDRPAFDVEQLEDDLQFRFAIEDQVNPAQTSREANRLRAEGERYDRWLIFMVGAVVLLTIGQVVRVRPIRVAFAGAGTAVWIVSTVMAYSGS